MIVQAEDISYTASGNLRDKQPQRCDPCKNVNHVNDVYNFTPLVKILSMKFSKPKILLENNYPDLEIAGKPLLYQAGKLLAQWLATPEWWQVHRWRYALAEESLGVSCLSTAIPSALVCAGDWCACKNIEAAYHSGIAAAESAIDLIKN